MKMDDFEVPLFQETSNWAGTIAVHLSDLLNLSSFVAATFLTEAELVFWPCFSGQGWMLPPGRLSALANLRHPNLRPFNSAVRSANSMNWSDLVQHSMLALALCIVHWEITRTRLRFLSVVDASPSQNLAFSISTLPETSRRSRIDLPFSIFQSKVFVQQSLAKRTFHCV